MSADQKSRRFYPVRALVISFLSMIAIGAILLILPFATADGEQLPLIDALFTSTSAVCVTGLIVRDTPVHFSAFGEITILILFQAGGIGILTFTTFFAAMMGRRIRYRDLNLFRDTFGSSPRKSIIHLLKLIILFTFAIEIVGALFLWPSFAREYDGIRPLYYSIFHSVSAFCNAGFTLFSNSLMSFRGDLLLNFVISALIIIGGIGFPVIFDIVENKRLSKLSNYSKLVISISLWLIFFGWLLVYFFESRTNPEFWDLAWNERVLTSLFQSITARTAGFNTLNIGAMALPSIMVLICLMFIGGSPGGTAGGIKTTTFAIAAKSAFVFLTGKRTVDIGGRKVSQSSQFRAGGLTFLYVMVLFGSAMLITALSDITLRDAAFEAASALGTVGLSTGVTGSLTSAQKIVVILLMFVGRIGPVSLALSLGFREKGDLAERPETDILTG